MKNWRIVKVATTKAQRKLFFTQIKKRLVGYQRRSLNAAELGCYHERSIQMESRMSSQDQTFDLTDNDNDESDNFAPVQYLEDKSSDVETLVSDANWERDSSQRLLSAIKTLDERSQFIIQSRWLADDKTTLHDLADKYDVSAERVRQIEKNAIKKLQAAMT